MQSSSPTPGTGPRSSPTQAGVGGFPNQLWLTCVSCQVGRISYKFVIVYRSAIAGGFIKEQNLFIYFLLYSTSGRTLEDEESTPPGNLLDAGSMNIILSDLCQLYLLY